ncbi:MAG TPA: hypothetical protein VNA57_02135 [Acidimicrobiales bacterium]|nr:hypothetical protein [Acidimicrobiales bacterium]
MSSVPTPENQPPKRKSWGSWRFLAYTLLVFGGIGVFSGLYDYSDDRFTETPFSDIATRETIIVECHGADQVGGPGLGEGVFDEICRQGLARRESNKSDYMVGGVAAAAAGIALFFYGRRNLDPAPPVEAPDADVQGPPAPST